MTDHLAAIRARCEAATEKWSVVKNVQTLVCGEKDGKLLIMADCIFKPDAAFIAHARTDIPALLAEVERMTAERDAALRRAEAAVDDLNRDGSCDTCKRGPDNHKCGKCGVGCYEWRGPCADAEGGKEE